MDGALAGKRILVVEDEYFIASDLKRALQKEDAIVLGPVGGVSQALALLEEWEPDAAVLDVNLEGSNSYPIADRLAEDAVPYMFLTGYDAWALPGGYRNVPRLAKPFSMHVMTAALGKLLAPAAVK